MHEVVVVDTGLGNVRSVEKAFAAAHPKGVRVVRSGDCELIRRAERLVVPGQGGFRLCAERFSGELAEALNEALRRGTPYFGICLGLQILFDSSEEAPGSRGLGHFGGAVRSLDATRAKVPHIGYNKLSLGAAAPALLSELELEPWFYFVHSYHAVPEDPELVCATVDYGEQELTAAVHRDNVFATQFHPEKSQRAGLALLRAFMEI